MPTLTIGGKNVEWHHISNYHGINDNKHNPNGKITSMRTESLSGCLAWVFNQNPSYSVEFISTKNVHGNNCFAKTATRQQARADGTWEFWPGSKWLFYDPLPVDATVQI